MSKFNEEQAQAEILSTLTEIKSALEVAISAAQAGPIRKADAGESFTQPIELEAGYLIGNWYIQKIKRL